jgi:hypothetical protein
MWLGYVAGCIHAVVTSTLKMEPLCSSDTLVLNYKNTRCHKPEDHNVKKYAKINNLVSFVND